MPPDPFCDSQHSQHDDIREHQRRERAMPHEGTKLTCASSSSTQIPLKVAAPQVAIDLTNEQDYTERPRRHPRDDVNSESSNKRLKLSMEDDTSDTARFQTVTKSEQEYQLLKSDKTRLAINCDEYKRKLKEKEQEIEAQRQKLTDTEAKLAAESETLSALRQTSLTARRKEQELQAQNARLQLELAENYSKLQAQEHEIEARRRDSDLALQQAAGTQQKLNIATQDLSSAKEDIARIQELLDATESDLQKFEVRVSDANQKAEAADTLAKAADIMNENWAVKFVKFDNDRKKLKKDLTEAKKKFRSAQKEHEGETAKLVVQIEELQKQIDTEQVEWNECKGKLLGKIRDLQGLSQRHDFKVSDQELIEKWETLKHNIRQFVDRYTRPIQGLDCATLSSQWLDMSPKTPAFLGSSIYYAFAFEAYLWKWLRRVVFQRLSMVWAGDMGKSFSDLSYKADRQLRGDNDDLLAEYHSWRSKSSNLLSRLSERTYNHESYEVDIKDLVDDLAQMLQFDAPVREDAALDLKAILNEARTFDVTRRKLKSEIRISCFVFDAEHKSVRYCKSPISTHMHDRSPLKTRAADNKESMVDLIISPSITRLGNSDGVGYDRETCLVKMEVLCNVSTDIQQRIEHQAESTAQAQPLTTEQLKQARSLESYDGAMDDFPVHRGDVYKGIKEEPGLQSEDSDLARSTAGQIAQPPARLAADKQRDGRDRISRRPIRSTRVTAQKQIATVLQDQSADELGYYSDSGEDKHKDQDMDSKPTKSRKREPQDDDDDWKPEMSGY